jgi:hypothetical protein
MKGSGLYYREDRAKDFLLGYSMCRRYIREDRRPDIPPWARHSPFHQQASFLLSNFDILLNLRLRSAIDHRSDLRARLFRISDPQAQHRLFEAIQETIVDRSMHDRP